MGQPAEQGSRQNAGIESRRSPRRVFRRPIGLLYRGSYVVARALQLSEGGLLLVSPWALSPGDQIAVTIMLPLGGSCVVRAEVLYPSPEEKGAFGAKFSELPLAQRRLIRSYVSAKTQQEATAENQ